MSKISDFEAFQLEISKIEQIYKEQTGKKMAKFFRPPEGKFSESNLEFANRLGYKTVFWSLAYADWDNKNQPDPEKAKQLILSRMHNGCVLLLHPTSATNAQIMDGLITELKNRGYEFGRLDEFE
jgi:peptidoglycan-N-acetylmuramic acid deacetylase